MIPLPLLAPLVLLAAALVAATRPGRRPRAVPRLSVGAALMVLLLVLAGAVQLAFTGPQTLGPLFRSDVLSTVMALLVGFVGWIVLRYTRNYLDGEAREGAFHALMLVTLAAVLALIHAASLPVMTLAFAVIGLILRQLLLFYSDRPEARRAALKFTLVWGAGDGALVLATALLWGQGGASFAAMGALPPSAATVAATALIVLAAALKTAAFPLHGWLTEVMEAPTPVSALLHAGVINAGGILLLRSADLVQASPGAMAALAMLGGLTALFGAVVMLTQSAIKTALAWSTISQMGFLLLQCGLGLWALALLHIIAHSLYKAHAFLASGGAVQSVAAIRRPGPVAVPSLSNVAHAFALALALYAAVATGFALLAGPKSAQALALGAMLVFGVAYLVAQGLADAAPTALTRRTALASAGATLAYFSFQMLATHLWGGALPVPPQPGALEWALIVLAVASFGLVAVAQALFPLWAHHPATAGLRVHVANGFYLNALLDRLIGGFRAKPQH